MTITIVVIDQLIHQLLALIRLFQFMCWGFDKIIEEERYKLTKVLERNK